MILGVIDFRMQLQYARPGSPNPVLGTGANRSIQLGLKLIW